MTGPLNLDPVALLAEWGRRVRANYEQAERLREPAPGADFYGPIAQSFKADPRRTTEPVLEVLRSLVRPGETWIDIGAGGGRYALPLALQGAHVIAVDPSPGMLAVLAEAAVEFDVSGVELVPGRWPLDDPPKGDVCFISHVAYDIADIGPFLDGMEASASRLCVAVLLGEAPATQAAGFWPAVHGEPRALLPALPEFLTLLLARGKLPSVWLGEREPVGYASAETVQSFARHQLFINEGSPLEDKMKQAVAASLTEVDGRFYLSRRPVPLGVVTWNP